MYYFSIEVTEKVKNVSTTWRCQPHNPAFLKSFSARQNLVRPEITGLVVVKDYSGITYALGII